jgi:hypothetical protein
VVGKVGFCIGGAQSESSLGMSSRDCIITRRANKSQNVASACIDESGVGRT